MAFIKAQELVLSKEKQDKAFCDTFIYEPENIQEKSLGNLYIVGEITEFSRGSNYLINLLVSVIRKEYYSNSKRTPLEALEAGLHRANLTLSDFIEEGNDDWIGNLNMICACFKDSELHFSMAGDARVFLIRSGEMIDLGRNLVSFNQKTQPLKTFANIASGSLEQGDKIILSTPEIFRITSAGTIKEIMGQFSLSAAAEKFKESLYSAGNIFASGILFLEMAEELEKEKIKSLPHIEIKPEGISESNQEFIAENEPLRLDEIIGRASLGEINKEEEALENPQAKSEFFENDSDSDNLFKNKLKQEQEIIQPKKEFVLSNLSKISGYFKKALIFLEKISIKAFGFMKNRFSSIAEKIKEKTEKPPEKVHKSNEEEKENKEIKIPSIDLKRSVKNLIEFPKTYKKLPKSSRILLGASLILIILLFGSIALLSQKRSQEIKITHYSGILKQAHQKEDEAEAALIYKDEEKARALLKEAKELTAQVLESRYLKDEAGELSALINEQVKIVDHIVLLSEISPLINFQEINQGAALSEIEITEGNLYSFDPSDNVIYEFDLENKEARIALADSNGIGHLQKSAVLKDSRIVFLTDSPGAASFDSVSETLKEQKIVFAENEKKFQDVSSYSNNIYLLDIENSQIWKHSGILAGFSNGKEWIKPGEEREFGNAVSLSIDGAIWILKSDGNVLKYVSGHKRDFKLGGLITSLNHPVKIFTAPHLKNLYILDPNNRRALVFNKKGEIASQFVSEKFNNLKDFTVSDDERKIYLLNGTEVFEVEM